MKKRWQEYTEELYKKDLHYPDNDNSVITLLEPHILECKVKWALGSIIMNKASRWWNSRWAISNPKMWCCESATLNMAANLENSAVATGLEKVSFHSNPKERQCQRMFNLLHNCTHLTCWQSNAQNSPNSLLKILQQYMNQELPDVQAGCSKKRNQRSNCQDPLDYQKSKRISEKHLLLLHWLH